MINGAEKEKHVIVPDDRRGTISLASRIYDATEITVSKTVNRLHQHDFYQCTLLKKINLPESIESIEDMSIYSCRKLMGAFPESRVPELCALIKKHFFRFTEYQTANHTVIEFAAKHRIIPIDHLLNKCSDPNTRAMLLNYANEFKNNNLDNYKI